jgi:hypothetical protein
MFRGSVVRVQMKLHFLLLIAPAFFGCAFTPNVDTRKPARPWNYYGDLASAYRDQTGGTKVALVWMDQVQFLRVKPNEFQKTVRTYLVQGYRKIGIISVRSQYFVDPYEMKKLAADKGARLVVGCWFTAHETKSQTRMVEYWYQLLDKASLPPASAVPQGPVLLRPYEYHRPASY